MTSKEAINSLWNDMRIGIWSDSSIEAIEKYKQDLERLEKLEKVIEILKDRLGLYLEYAKLEETEFYSIMSKVLGMCLFNTTKEEYDLLKEVEDDD